MSRSLRACPSPAGAVLEAPGWEFDLQLWKEKSQALRSGGRVMCPWEEEEQKKSCFLILLVPNPENWGIWQQRGCDKRGHTKEGR